MIELAGELIPGAELVTAFPGAPGSVAPLLGAPEDGFGFPGVGATEDFTPVTLGELSPSVVGADGSVAVGCSGDGEVVSSGDGSVVFVVVDGSVDGSDVVELEGESVVVTVLLRVSVTVTPGTGALSALEVTAR